MHKYYPRPTIIGSGLTGLLISNALTKARVGHVLIGGPPPEGSPRLGESLNIEATLYFLEEFPELADYYYEKAFATVYAGDIVGKFPFSFIQEPQSRVVLNLAGHEAPGALIHFDRVALDAAIYEKAINSPYCTELDTRVAQIECVAGTDTIDQLVLQDGEVLPVSHVFDATGYIRLVARQLNIQRQMLGERQHALYVHYFRNPESASESTDAGWHHGTNIVRLYDSLHGVDGLAWCVPLGNTISVGVTTPDGATRPDDEALLQLVQEAFAGCDINYMDECEKRSRLATAKMEFYTHARCYGPNWLLASAAHTQVWWPTSAGLDTSVAAAQAAVPFLTQPEAVGQRYRDYFAPLIRSQKSWNWATSHSYDEVTRAKTQRFANRLFWSIQHRTLHSFSLDQRDPVSRSVVSLATRLWENEFFARLPSPVLIDE